MRFRFTIDATVLTRDPEGWEGFDITIRRDYQNRFLYVEYNTALIFTKGAGFDQLYLYLSGNDYDGLADFKVEYSTDEGATYSLLFDAYIDMTDASYDLQRRTIEARIIDTSLAALINTNWDLDITTGSAASKNGTAITKATLATKTFQLVSKQGTRNRTIYVMEWDDLVQYLIQYVTDGTISVVNNFYTALTDKLYLTPKVFLTKGIKEIEPETDWDDRAERNGLITTSIDEAINGVMKLYALFMTVVNNAGIYQAHIDEEDDTYSTTTALTVTDISTEEIRINTDRFYSEVQLGEQETKGAGVYYATNSSLYGWDEFKAQLKGQGNLRGNILDLTTTLIYSGVTIFTEALKQVITETGGDDYVFTADVDNDDGKTALMVGSASQISAQTTTKGTQVAEADTAAEVADITNYNDQDLVSDQTNVVTYSQFLNAKLANDIVIARHSLPFDAYVAANPDDLIETVLKINANQGTKTRSSYTPATIDITSANDVLEIRGNIAGASDPYNQVDNTNNRYQAGSLAGRIDEYFIDGVVAVNIQSMTSEGAKVFLLLARTIDDVVYIDSIDESSNITATGLANHTLTGRRYIPMTDKETLQILVAVIPTGTNPVFSGLVSGWTGWTYSGTFWTVTSDEILGDNSGSGSPVTETIELDDDLENGYEYTLSFDYPAATGGTCTVNVYTGTTFHSSVVIGGIAGSSGDIVITVPAAPQDNLILSCDFDAGCVAQIENFVLQKKFTVQYDIRANNTVVNIDQLGFDGSAYATASPLTYKGYEVEIEGKALISEWKTLMDDPRKRVSVNGRLGWPLLLSFTPHTGRLDGTLITDHNNLNL